MMEKIRVSLNLGTSNTTHGECTVETTKLRDCIAPNAYDNKYSWTVYSSELGARTSSTVSMGSSVQLLRDAIL